MILEIEVRDYKTIIPLIYPFLTELRKLFPQNDERILFDFFMNFCGYLFSGIVCLIIKLRMKIVKNKTSEKINNINDILIETTQKELNENASRKETIQQTTENFPEELEKIIPDKKK